MSLIGLEICLLEITVLEVHIFPSKTQFSREMGVYFLKMSSREAFHFTHDNQIDL